MSRWKWVNHGGQRYHDIGLDADGTLHNPNGYPDDIVRLAIAAAEERAKARRKKAAAKAAATRKKRRERRVYEVADKILEGHEFGPSSKCAICRKAVDDQKSRERGIGSDCWQLILRAI